MLDIVNEYTHNAPANARQSKMILLMDQDIYFICPVILWKRRTFFKVKTTIVLFIEMFTLTALIEIALALGLNIFLVLYKCSILRTISVFVILKHIRHIQL